MGVEVRILNAEDFPRETFGEVSQKLNKILDLGIKNGMQIESIYLTKDQLEAIGQETSYINPLSGKERSNIIHYCGNVAYSRAQDTTIILERD